MASTALLKKTSPPTSPEFELNTPPKETSTYVCSITSGATCSTWPRRKLRDSLPKGGTVRTSSVTAVPLLLNVCVSSTKPEKGMLPSPVTPLFLSMAGESVKQSFHFPHSLELLAELVMLMYSSTLLHSSFTFLASSAEQSKPTPTRSISSHMASRALFSSLFEVLGPPPPSPICACSCCASFFLLTFFFAAMLKPESIPPALILAPTPSAWHKGGGRPRAGEL
mmetsp:Transcript_22679/g.52665  ORF Transcript_22679/g.52665 Transcript_22679/m.52665 type:complete len:224 (-) Transcript_22679:156-827(-)